MHTNKQTNRLPLRIAILEKKTVFCLWRNVKQRRKCNRFSFCFNSPFFTVFEKTSPKIMYTKKQTNRLSLRIAILEKKQFFVSGGTLNRGENATGLLFVLILHFLRFLRK